MKNEAEADGCIRYSKSVKDMANSILTFMCKKYHVTKEQIFGLHVRIEDDALAFWGQMKNKSDTQKFAAAILKRVKVCGRP